MYWTIFVPPNPIKDWAVVFYTMVSKDLKRIFRPNYSILSVDHNIR
ncbi:hypothetical protein B0I21_107258 [Sphingobacterium paludis]|uniref:Uncharacterized protein n=1 Tax=Sphingobacterium paludis TaxID=1476465 RepID=A0A4R7CZD7_9SPHI|nr:hypothetical protein B0I21_107258 [Sphingobacterium paludis]